MKIFNQILFAMKTKKFTKHEVLNIKSSVSYLRLKG